jgi:hypothetical protein
MDDDDDGCVADVVIPVHEIKRPLSTRLSFFIEGSDVA